MFGVLVLPFLPYPASASDLLASLSVVWLWLWLGAGSTQPHVSECSGLTQQLIAARSRVSKVLCSKRRADALPGERRGMDRVVTPPHAVIVPEVMIWICGPTALVQTPFSEVEFAKNYAS